LLHIIIVMSAPEPARGVRDKVPRTLSKVTPEFSQSVESLVGAENENGGPCVVWASEWPLANEPLKGGRLATTTSASLTRSMPPNAGSHRPEKKKGRR
jgi:hypothetical protein